MAHPSDKKSKFPQDDSFQDWSDVKWVKEKPPAHQSDMSLTNTQKELLTDDVPKLKYVPKEFGIQITQSRIRKNMTRKQLANALSIQESLVADFETGKALYHGPMISKFKTYFGLHK